MRLYVLNSNALLGVDVGLFLALVPLQYPDYYDVIQDPMNLKTIRSKIKCGKYDSIDEFLQDTELIFSNCFKYHKRHSEIGKAGSSLKRFFEKRCNDLGLRDLGISLRPIRRRRK